MDPRLPGDVASLEEWLYFADRFQAGNYLTIASLVFLLYDHLLTLPEEIDCIWKTRPRFTVAKCLFYVIRYVSPSLPLVRIITGIAPTPGLCSIGLDFTGYACVMIIACVEAMLMLRVWALYGGSKMIAIFFFSLGGIGIVAGILISRFVGLSGQEVLPFLIPTAPYSVTGCVGYGVATKYFFLYIIAAVGECIVFGLTIAKALSYSRAEKTPVILALVRHGCLYFAVVFIGLTLTIASFTSGFLAQPFINSNLSVSLNAMACSRLMLSLRGVYDSMVRAPELPTRTGTTMEWSEEGSLSIYMPDFKSKDMTTTTTGTSSIGRPTWHDRSNVEVPDRLEPAETGNRREPSNQV